MTKYPGTVADPPACDNTWTVASDILVRRLKMGNFRVGNFDLKHALHGETDGATVVKLFVLMVSPRRNTLLITHYAFPRPVKRKPVDVYDIVGFCYG